MEIFKIWGFLVCGLVLASESLNLQKAKFAQMKEAKTEG